LKIAEKRKSDLEIVRIENGSKNYVLGNNIVYALRGVTMAVQSGEFLALAGPSGSGKTTMLNIMGCIEKPSSGRVFIDGEDVSDLSSDQLAEIRAQKLSFIFQNFNLLPVLTAMENVEFPLLKKKASPKERRERSTEALEMMGLLSFKDHKPMELSGGQRQRVAIARAMVVDPKLILADEPTANLDHKTGTEILDLMTKLNQTRGTTFVFSTHDQIVMERASRIIHLWDGEIAE